MEDLIQVNPNNKMLLRKMSIIKQSEVISGKTLNM